MTIHYQRPGAKDMASGDVFGALKTLIINPSQSDSPIEKPICRCCCRSDTGESTFWPDQHKITDYIWSELS